METKKFYTSFRPQFNTEQKCNDMGKVYYDLGYGYFCSSDQDDCGDTYYQLILSEVSGDIYDALHWQKKRNITT